MSVPKSSHDIRRTFLEYFAELGHEIVPSSSLVPAGDPTLLFTNAGMNQFKDLFLGLEKRSYTRAASAQKCMRVSGKHNDLENVGPSPRHHTFFEMLGNFSFGDYFKKEAIEYAWVLLTDVFQLPVERLWATVYLDDDEAFEYWTRFLPPERILRFGKEENFWEMGETGPCGPCSEIHYYLGPLDQQTAEGVNRDDEYVELWNLVFMQFDRDADGNMTPLPKPSIDTGMGLERIAMVMQGVRSTYETDLFLPIMDRIQALLGHTDADRQANTIGYRVIADHLRAATFLVGDGVLPGSEGRSYVARLILRRAMRFGHQLGFDDPFVAQVAETVIDEYGHHYQELKERQDFILQVLAQEEERFRQTLETGTALLDELLDRLEQRGEHVVPGEEAFRLYDTYGFPYDLTRLIAEERGFSVDRAGFDRAMAEQRAKARAASAFDTEKWAYRYRDVDAACSFVGYDYSQLTEVPTQILVIFRDGERVPAARAGDTVELVLSVTPFYAEGGGQVADAGIVETDYGRVLITDVQRAREDLWVHFGTVVEGTIRELESARASVDVERRWDIMRNHTATHLLHRALRNVLGEHAEQRGSLVAPDYLRFDFLHLQAVTREELRRIEQEVVEHIMADEAVTWEYMPRQEAMAQGVTALFGEKYGETVRVLRIGSPDGRNGRGEIYSAELCGGTHVIHTGQIGPFLIVSESSIGNSIRRIVAYTGRKATEYIREHLDHWNDMARALGVPAERLPAHVRTLDVELHRREKIIADLRRKLASLQVRELVEHHQSRVDGVPVVAARVEALGTEHLRDLADLVRDRLGSGVAVLGTVSDGKPLLVAAVTPDLAERGLHAGHLAKHVAQLMGGGGGGRPTMAQAGGRDATKLPEALQQVPDIVRQMLA
ncbi:MAG: alanine--tRNA ligase [Ardenticatenia bacterium]|nr:alanine--tRNA ligase [Ardenticatenia bacterium]